MWVHKLTTQISVGFINSVGGEAGGYNTSKEKGKKCSNTYFPLLKSLNCW